MEEKLRKVYDNPATTSKRANILASRAGVLLEDAEKFLKHEQTAQQSKQFVKPKDLNHYSPTGAEKYHWQSDVLFFNDFRGVNDKRIAILTVLNTTTRLVYARPLLGVKSSEIAHALKSIIDEISADGLKIIELRVDGGSEYKGEVIQLLHSLGIKIEHIEPNTHYKLARTDRFHRTLRKRIGEHFEMNNTHRWIDSLQDMIKNYNSTPHRTLSEILDREASPKSVSSNDEDKIRKHERKQAELAYQESEKLNIIPGKTKVRLLVKAMKSGNDKFAKSHKPVWSSETYDILGRNGPNSWLVDVPYGEVKIYPSYALQIVETEVLKKPSKVGQKVVIADERFKRAFAREISEDEQKRNLEAPLHPRSQRAAKVDYKKML